ncbi:MAG: DEAD/DEAH box helicase [Sphaerochaeta sp.]
MKGELDPVIFRALKRVLTYIPKDHPRPYGRKLAPQGEEGVLEECLLCRAQTGEWYFPVGVLDRVQEVLDSINYDYHLVNDVELPGDTLGIEWTSDKTLYDYQEKAAEITYLNNGGTISLPTGAGKSLIGLRLIYAFDHRTLILVNSRELMKQWRGLVNENLGIDPGMVGGGFKENWDDITVASIQTISSRLKKRKMASIDLNYPVLLLDECHHTPANDAYTVAMMYNSPVRIGLTATPYRTDGNEMKIWGAIGDVCARITAVDLIKMGRLTPPRFVILDPPYVKMRKVNDWQDAYYDGIVANQYRNKMIVEAAQEMVKEGNKVYIHVERIEHGEILEIMFGEEVPFIHGSTAKGVRDEIIQKFADGEIKCLISTLLGEGVDIPTMTAIIMAGGLKTPVGTVQKVGRALRLSPGKTEAIIVDFRDKGPWLSKHFQERMNVYRETYGGYVDKGGKR